MSSDDLDRCVAWLRVPSDNPTRFFAPNERREAGIAASILAWLIDALTLVPAPNISSRRWREEYFLARERLRHDGTLSLTFGMRLERVASKELVRRLNRVPAATGKKQPARL